MPRREKWAIVGAILGALEAESLKGTNARLTSVAARANVAYDRLQDYLSDLERHGFVSPGRVPALTAKGRDFLKHYRHWIDLIDRFGFGTAGEWPPAPEAARAVSAVQEKPSGSGAEF